MLFHQGLPRASLQQGMATGPTESAYPALWNELAGFWAPSAGHQGIVTLRDFSGRGNHGTLEGSMTNGDWIIGRDGYALDLDGDNDAVNIGSIVSGNPLMLSGHLSISAWIKPKKTGDDYQRIVDKSTAGSAADGYAFYLDITSFYPRFASGGSAAGSADTAPATNQWSLVTVTKAAGTTLPKFYINGIQTGYSSGTTVGDPPVATANLRFGTWNHTTGREFSGGLGDVMIHRRVLPPSEILQMAHGASPLQLRSHLICKAPAVVPSVTPPDMIFGHFNNPVAFGGF